ncbi:MAG: helix-turn-helix transcriptional regulator [Ruminococcaceae bacterium]|nr:helix-turn-helix transcriptional regulator [Oscillospiraceae bacterium]
MLASAKMAPTDQALVDIAELYSLLADGTRLKILFALLETELCVCALCELLSMEQSAVSHQLRKLKNANLVKSRHEGRYVVYSLADEHVRSLLMMSYKHLTEG